MRAVHPLPFVTRSGLALNHHPQRKDWFDDPVVEPPIEAERHHRPDRLAAAWWYIALDNACHTQLLTEAAGTPQPIPHEQAALTHSQISSPSGATHSGDALWQGLVAAEPELLA